MDSISVLLVEDEALILTMTEDALTEAGFAVATASRGSQALKMLDAPDAAYRAVITDIDLGDCVMGWDIARRARERSPEAAIVL